MKRPQAGRGLFYTRDSGGQHEMTPGQYVAWAAREAGRLGVSFEGAKETIEQMIQDNQFRSANLFLDYDVKGNQLSRPGLDALLKTALGDHAVSHVFIPRRDRLARPDNPVDGITLELQFRSAGITLVFTDKVCGPIQKGSRQDIAELIVSVVDYDRAGKDRRDLADKIIRAQLALANAGYSTGGRPPYGFRRWLVRDDGTIVRELAEGERLRMRGHHVIWRPVPDDNAEMIVIRRILDLLPTRPASQVAKLLNNEGIPSPDFGRTRTDRGIEHRTSGIWHSTTISNIARNKLLVAVASYGRRSMGDQLRLSAEGPRPLTERDFRNDGKPKVISNGDGIVRRTASFDPITPPDEHDELIRILDKRAGTQRGKPRSRDPSMNPLGGRAYDMNCGWSLYRVPYNGSFRYSCGFYMQSHGAECSHNHVDGPTATRFIQACLKQRLLTPTAMTKLEAKLRQFAEQERVDPGIDADLNAKQAALERIERDLSKASRNLALAETEDDHRSIAAVCRDLRKEKSILEEKIASSRATSKPTSNIETEIEAAMSVVDRLPDMVADASQFAMISEAYRIADVKLYIAFSPMQLKKRTVNKVSHGVVTFGATPPPIELYRGPTGRRAMQLSVAATVAAGSTGDNTLPDRGDDGREDKSLGNVNRGDRI